MGGDYKKNLSINLGLFDQEGVILNSTNKRWFLNTSAKTKAFGDKIDIYSRTNLSYKEGNASSVGNGQIFMQKSVVSQVLQFQPIYSLLDTGETDDVYSSLNEGDLISNPYTLAKYCLLYTSPSPRD